jgi:TolB-like protein/Tfp pilus assembly protein PilF
MEIDEEGTLAALKAHRRELIDPLLTQHQGRIVKTMGDGLLIEFASIVDAVRCAVVMQQGMERRNANIDEDLRIRFRIGINMGDVIVEVEDIFGDGVNVAARLEALGEPGQTCVSATVREHVAEKLPIGFADMGEHTVKNIARPVHVYRIETPIGSEKPNLAKSMQGMLTLPERPSIAVLPFTNLSGDPEQEYLADGVVEDIITGLSRIKWLFVIARNSSFSNKGRAVNVKQVGRELGVRYVLEGSIRKAANRVRITGQLIEADTDRHIWADRYDRILDDVFAIQDELTMSVVAAIEPSLRQAEIERVKRKRPDSLDAYDLLLRAMPLVYTAMPDGAAKALPFLESALKIEPDYALAHAYAAFAHEIIFARGGMGEENRTSATRHAYEAITYGRDDAIALTIGGFVIALVAHDREAAQQALEAALTVSPSCALTYVLGSVVLVYDGQADKGIEWGERALRLSPFDPMSQGPLLAIALGRLQRGEYEAAAEAAHKGVQAKPYWSLTHVALAASQAKLGRLESAKSSARRVLELQPEFTIGGLCTSFDFHPSLAEPLSEALKATGLLS